MINTSANDEDKYRKVYFAFGSSVLGTAYSFRYPSWFISGLSEVFQYSSVDHSHVTIGGASPGRVSRLLRGSWIPLRTLLSVHANDPQMASSDFQEMYYSQTWYLVHKIVIDQFYYTNFHQYFERLDRGEDEASAFAASFDISYEDLGKALEKSVASGKFLQLKVTIADEDDGSRPIRLGEAAAKGRLAAYVADHGVQPDGALALAASAIKLDSGNEDAQIARVRAELRAADSSNAFRNAGDLCGSETLSSRVLKTCAFVFASLSHKDKALVGASHAELNSKAVKFYEKELLLDPEDLQSWYGLAKLTASARDTDYAKSLLPKVTAVQAAHAHVGRSRVWLPSCIRCQATMTMR